MEVLEKNGSQRKKESSLDILHLKTCRIRHCQEGRALQKNGSEKKDGMTIQRRKRRLERIKGKEVMKRIAKNCSARGC